MKNRLLIAGLWLLFSAHLQAANCPFCSAVAQTLRQEINQMDVAVIASFVSADSESTATFAVKRVLRGSTLVQTGEEFSVNYFGKAKADDQFLLMGIDPPDFAWSSPLKVNDKVLTYVNDVLSLPTDDSLSRLEFFLKHLGEKDPTISRDVFDEFASASYTEMIAIKEQYDRTKLIEWIQDLELSPDRRKLYLVMLGICGLKEDAEVLEKMLLSDDPNKQAGLDALIACYLTLKGEAGLKIVNEKYLGSKDAGYSEIYSAVMALRFHGTEGGVIDRKVIAKSMQLLLDRPKLADLVIPDLARWEDWSQIDKVVKLFKESEDSQATWLRIPVFNYLKACPLPEAAIAIEELKQIDPANYKRAMQFFPQQQPAATDSSQFRHQSAVSDVVAFEPRRLRSGDKLALASSFSAPPAKQRAAGLPNLLSVASVLGTFSATLWLGMWLTITGAGRQPRWLLRILGR